MGGGCVIAASYEAKAKGVKTGMRLKDALLLCPEAIRQPSDFRETGLASQQIEKILQDHCPRIEQTSIDEWYLDLPSCVGGTPIDVTGWAVGVQKMILRNTALSVSVGVGPSKLLAKMAGEYRKPGGVTVVSAAAGTGVLPVTERRDVRIARLYNEPIGIESFLRTFRPAYRYFCNLNQLITKNLFKNTLNGSTTRRFCRIIFLLIIARG
jgi:hypothetical protein